MNKEQKQFEDSMDEIQENFADYQNELYMIYRKYKEKGIGLPSDQLIDGIKNVLDFMKLSESFTIR